MKNSIYDDIIDLPHHVSVKRPQMSMQDRAAQFSPFAALVGFYDQLAETDKQAESFAELDENYLQELDAVLCDVQARIASYPLVEVTYFIPKESSGKGKYCKLCDNVKKIEKTTQALTMLSGKIIPVKYIVKIELI